MTASPATRSWISLRVQRRFEAQDHERPATTTHDEAMMKLPDHHLFIQTFPCESRGMLCILKPAMGLWHIRRRLGFAKMSKFSRISGECSVAYKTVPSSTNMLVLSEEWPAHGRLTTTTLDSGRALRFEKKGRGGD